MQYIDVLTAFAITLAVFAGTVTTIVEIINRLLLARRRKLLSVLCAIDDDLARLETVKTYRRSAA